MSKLEEASCIIVSSFSHCKEKLGKAWERLYNTHPLPFPQKKKDKQNFLWFRFMDSIYWPSGPCALCHLDDNDLHFLESAVYNDCKDTRAEWEGEHFKGT